MLVVVSVVYLFDFNWTVFVFSVVEAEMARIWAGYRGVAERLQTAAWPKMSWRGSFKNHAELFSISWQILPCFAADFPRE
jgi:hypothetical protein